MSTVSALTIYSIRRNVDGARVEDFDAPIVSTKLDDANLATRDFVAQDDSWAARLYLWPGEERPPAWLPFLKSGYGDDLALPESAQSSAVIVVRVFFRRDRYFAIAFGGGWRAIKSSAVEPKYGLQVALNAIYEGDESTEILDPAARVQQVNTRTVRANTIRTLRQTNRSADFDVFELDPDGDQLDGITGKPLSISLGNRVRGTDSLRVSRTFGFPELGEICRNLARYHERSDYQRRFAFVDSIKAETNANQIADLNDAAVASFLANGDAWAMAPPELLDFDAIDVFEIPDLGISGAEIVPAEVSNALNAEGATTPGELAKLFVRGLDANGDVVDQWSVLKCLDGQVELADTTYLVEAGEYYKVAADYLEELDEYVSDIRRSGVVLPDSVKVMKDGELKEITEGKYNQIAADSSSQFILLDKELVKISSKTSPIEICDVLTLSGQMVHVKRKFSSSSLSHLFAQGYVSSELLSDSQEYLAAIRATIPDEHAQFRELFPDAGLVTANFEIVYAIIGDWTGKQLTDIPFFSKVNLRRYTRALRRLQYQVTFADIKVVAP